MVNAYLFLTKITDPANNELGYAILVGMGNLCVCDAWFLELSDLDALEVREEVEKVVDLNQRYYSDGVLMFKDKEPLKKIMDIIAEKHPHGFCLGCVRAEYRSKIRSRIERSTE
jgi:hypothetical protein